MTSDARRAAYLAAVAREDASGTFASTDPDLLLDLGAGLAVQAFEGQYGAAVAQAVNGYGIPREALDLLAAAYLAEVAPVMAAAILAQPNEGSAKAIRGWLRRSGYRRV
ncbi:hypothetical protein [Microbacterium sp. IEGM 1404]|uniref:hypothetical protein n=1 Tax=Microbacterium sp. IEGM 1404 TaxID=3047084 RepID=UPI0024B82144|nr:hypothetical protein [Microbacterium sp. IEGM 1404]MDI9890564.1 hypothetical protein [Microbacterium sp. IEGM 1404]